MTTPTHPFFNIQDNDEVRFLNISINTVPITIPEIGTLARLIHDSNPPVVVDPSRPRFKISIEESKVSTPVDSIEDAEQKFFDLIVDSDDFNKNDNQHSLGIVLNRKSNNIAEAARRGPGNVIVMNERLYDDFVTMTSIVGSYVGIPDEMQDDDSNYGWTNRGILNYSAKVYTSKHFPENKIAMLYYGSVNDCVATIVDSDDGKRMHLIGVDAEVSYKDYVRVINIV